MSGRENPDEDAGIPGDPGGDIVIKPADPTLDVTYGVPATPQAFTATTKDGVDVTGFALWTLDDTQLGSFQGNKLVPTGTKGGTSTVRAMYKSLIGRTSVRIKLHAKINDSCPGCPTIPDGPECTDSGRKPTLVYPPNGPLMPPNLNVIEAQWDKGQSNTLYEVVFSNSLTDVRLASRCTAVSDARNIATSGCALELSQKVWDLLINTNRGGEPIDIMVRATDDTKACVSKSNTNSIRIAEKDLPGGIYYWQSVTNMGMPGKSGGIYRYDFGKRGVPPEAYLDAATQGRCVGCHFLTRDGQKMTYGTDDADADDEYWDLQSWLIDVGTKGVSKGQTTPGFQTWSPDRKLIIATDGQGTLSPPAFQLLDGNTHAQVAPGTVPTGGQRGTHPDWSPDGRNIVFVRPTKVLPNHFSIVGYDDHHFVGGSLMLMSTDPDKKTFGNPTVLLAQTGGNNGTNYFYPAFSPDSSFVLFNSVAAGSNELEQDAYYNIKARIQLLAMRMGAKPVDMMALNGGKQDYTNSWPRFCPLIQTYKGHKIVWVTFSSTRDYGFRIRNSVQVPSGGKMLDQVNCYPPYSPQPTNNSGNCHQPQLWMGAIDLTEFEHSEVGNLDTSYPAFWLPLQDLKSNNHTAQWVTKVVEEPPPDGGCVPGGGDCTRASCCGGFACIDGKCTLP